MMQLEAAGATDVGRVRRNNQDAFLMGQSVFAVADGMGGHVAGEVAAATALEPIEQLDGHVYPDGPAAVSAVVDAVVAANAEVSAKSSSDLNYQGMGTTLTAAVFEGRRMHIAHVGDSRAYLLRGGEFDQLTTDHTLVQHLIDEGQITAEEASSHPQRSIITRAIGVSDEVEVDSMSLDLEPGDVILLCSDGLTGFVSDDEIRRILRSERPLDHQVQALIDTANEAGGSDNITAVLLRYDGPTSTTPPPGHDAEDAARGPVVVRTSPGEGSDDWAQRLGRLGAPGGAAGGDDQPRSRRWVPVTIGVIALLVLGVIGGRWLLSRSYYVGLEVETVVIYQGIPVDLGPVGLSWVVERTSLRTGVLPDYYVEDLADGIPAIDRRDARLIIENAPRRNQPAPDPTTDPSPTESP